MSPNRRPHHLFNPCNLLLVLHTELATSRAKASRKDAKLAKVFYSCRFNRFCRFFILQIALCIKTSSTNSTNCTNYCTVWMSPNRLPCHLFNPCNLLLVLHTELETSRAKTQSSQRFSTHADLADSADFLSCRLLCAQRFHQQIQQIARFCGSPAKMCVCFVSATTTHTNCRIVRGWHLSATGGNAKPHSGLRSDDLGPLWGIGVIEKPNVGDIRLW